MNDYKIRLGRTDSVDSVNRENFLGVQLESTSKKLHFNDIKATIDQYEQFQKERSLSNKYRVILTINPYCTNVLFNPLTEVAKLSDDGVSIERYYNNNKTTSGIDGNSTPLRVQMVCNTEYSKTKESSTVENDENYGYTYMPGYDIFDNHILRNKGFKIVEPLGNGAGGQKRFYNTIADYYRNPDGTTVTFRKRTSLSEKPKKTNQHLYSFDDVFSFDESVNANLTDENGWFGFINASSLRTVSPGENGTPSDICCVINDRKNCEFIDMYPDRTTFSFSPYYNKAFERLENNWDVFITYVWKSDECNPITTNGSVNALAVLSVTNGTGITGEEILVFRTYTKHNLKKGDTIKIYDGDSETPTEPIGLFTVSNVGNAGRGDSDYYFYLNSYGVEYDFSQSSDIRFVKSYNGMDSRYYMRKLKKIKKLVGDEEKELNSERYKLAFASTVYDDDTTQVTFTDDIDVSDLVDNFGRPITELFITIVKTHKGNDVWYSEGNEINGEDVEISHCFSDLTAGFVFGHEKSDGISVVNRGDENIPTSALLEDMRDIRYINNNNHFKSRRIQIEVKSSDDEFICDIVEFSPEDCVEHVLSDCAYRFNTYQRENPKPDTKFIYHEILYDDYDVADGDFIKTEKIDIQPRDEGYYYKANYSIPIRDVGGISEAGHKDIRVKSVKISYNGNIVLRVTSSLPSRLNTNDIVYVCDDKNDKKFEFVCTEVKSPTVFTIEPRITDYNETVVTDKWVYFSDKVEEVYGNGYTLNWLQLSEMLSNGEFKLRGKNYDIPEYAFKFGKNSYMWRMTVRPGESSSTTVPEYVFANDSFYVTPIIRFFLKRQDPDSSIGLQAKDVFPNDVFGNIKKESNYYYEDEPQDLC